MIIRLRDRKLGPSVETELWFGEEGRPLRMAGLLVMDLREYQTFGAALLLGARHMMGRLRVENEGEREMLAEFAREEDHR